MWGNKPAPGPQIFKLIHGFPRRKATFTFPQKEANLPKFSKNQISPKTWLFGRAKGTPPSPPTWAGGLADWKRPGCLLRWTRFLYINMTGKTWHLIWYIFLIVLTTKKIHSFAHTGADHSSRHQPPIAPATLLRFARARPIGISCPTVRRCLNFPSGILCRYR